MKGTSRRAAEARRLLDEPLLNEAIDRLERETIDEMLRAWSDRKRRMLGDRILVIRSIKSHLKSVVLTGETRNKISVA